MGLKLKPSVELAKAEKVSRKGTRKQKRGDVKWLLKPAIQHREKLQLIYWDGGCRVKLVNCVIRSSKKKKNPSLVQLLEHKGHTYSRNQQHNPSAALGQHICAVFYYCTKLPQSLGLVHAAKNQTLPPP